MARPRYALFGIGLMAAAVVSMIAIAAAPIDLTVAAELTPYVVLSTALAFTFIVTAPRLFRDQRQHSTLSASFSNITYPAGLTRARAFLSRLLSPMSGGHRLAGSVSMTAL